jgi:hypothetical protein
MRNATSAEPQEFVLYVLDPYNIKLPLRHDPIEVEDLFLIFLPLLFGPLWCRQRRV